MFLIWPIVQVVRVGFFGIPASRHRTFTLAYFAAIFQDHSLRQGLLNSALIAVSVTLVCTLISVPLALMSVRFDFWGKAIVSGLLLVPLILPPFVGAIGMRQILGRFGVLTSLAQDVWASSTPARRSTGSASARIFGIILVESLEPVPDPVPQRLAPRWRTSTRRWSRRRRTSGRRAGRSSGRSRCRSCGPGLFAGGTIVLIWSFTELGTPLMFDFYEATPVQIFHRITQVSGNPVPYALVVVMLLASVLLYVIGKLVLGRRQDAAVTKASVQSAPRKLGPVASISGAARRS